jgi:RNA polymerase sigma factor (sigma-70 family)
MANEKDRWSMWDDEGREVIVKRIEKVAAVTCYGWPDYHDTVQDMVMYVIERQADDPEFEEQKPAFQVRGAKWHAQDLRRRDRGQDLPRRRFVYSLDNSTYSGDDDETACWYEAVPGEPPADKPLLAKEHAAARETVRARVRDAIRALTPAQRDAIIQRFWFNRSCTEAAKALGVTKGTVLSNSHAAYEKLRAEMDDLQSVL